MVKKPSLKTKRPVGRPRKDPDDLRSIRFAFRLHPDLYVEVSRFSRIAGLSISTWVERTMIEKVNELEGAQVVDAIGRYFSSQSSPQFGIRNPPPHQRARKHKDPKPPKPAFVRDHRFDSDD